MKMRWSSGFLALGLLALAWAGAPTAVVAQDTRVECRCIDESGEELDDCQCIRMPNVERILDRSEMSWFGGRPRLGVSVDPTQSASDDALGAVVSDVLEGGPAGEAGIREGDIITSIGGQSLLDPLPGDEEEDFDLDESVPVQRLLAIARELEPGEDVEVRYLRDGDARTASVEAEELSNWGNSFTFVGPDWDVEEFSGRMRDLAERVRAPRFEFRHEFDEGLAEIFEDDHDVRVRVAPRERVIVRGGPSSFARSAGGSAAYGLELVELNPELGAYFGASEGALVVDLDEDSQLGLEPGDVILSVGGREATTPARVIRILGSYSDDESIEFRVRRDGRDISVSGRLEH